MNANGRSPRDERQRVRLAGYGEAATIALRVAPPKARRVLAVSLAFGMLARCEEPGGSIAQAELFEALMDAYDAGPEVRE